MSALATIESFGLNQPRTIIAITAALVTLYYFRQDNKDYLGIPKSPNYTGSKLILFIRGLLLDINTDLGQEDLRTAQNEKYRPLMWISNIVFPGIAIHSPSILRDLLVDGQQQYREGFTIMRAPFASHISQTMFSGPSLANVSGEDWKWRRRLMVPLFQPRRLVPQLLPYVVERTNELIELIKSSPNKDGLNIDSLLVFLTFDVICKYLFGKAGPHELDFSAIGGYEMTSKAMKDIADGFTKSYPWTLLPLIGRTKWAHEPALTARTRIRNFVRTAILQCISSEDSQITEPVVKALAKAPQFDPTTEEGLDLLISEAIILLFAGHDTTAHTISFTLGYTAQDPDIQFRILEEVHNTFGSDSVEPSSINAADVSKLTYITSVLREVGRIHPISTIVVMNTAQDITIAGHKIPRNQMLIGNLRACGMDPTIFAEPFNFNPSRWLLEDSDAFIDLDSGSGHTKLPELNFSMGTHMCLGRNLAILEMRTVVAMLIQKFEIGFKEGFSMGIMTPSLMKPKGGMWLTFKERK